MIDDLIKRLIELANYEHDDHKVAEEAAELIRELNIAKKKTMPEKCVKQMICNPDPPHGVESVHKSAYLLCYDDLNRVRQWFDAVQDINENFLKQEDYQLAKKIYEKLSMRVPRSIINGA